MKDPVEQQASLIRGEELELQFSAAKRPSISSSQQKKTKIHIGVDESLAMLPISNCWELIGIDVVLRMSYVLEGKVEVFRKTAAALN